MDLELTKYGLKKCKNGNKDTGSKTTETVQSRKAHASHKTVYSSEEEVGQDTKNNGNMPTDTQLRVIQV